MLELLRLRLLGEARRTLVSRTWGWLRITTSLPTIWAVWGAGDQHPVSMTEKSAAAAPVPRLDKARSGGSGGSLPVQPTRAVPTPTGQCRQKESDGDAPYHGTVSGLCHSVPPTSSMAFRALLEVGNDRPLTGLPRELKRGCASHSDLYVLQPWKEWYPGLLDDPNSQPTPTPQDSPCSFSEAEKSPVFCRMPFLASGVTCSHPATTLTFTVKDPMME